MKHIFSFFLLVALLTSCTAEAQKINVEVITDAKSTKAFVIDTEKPNEPIMTVDVSDSICFFELPAKEGQFLLVATDGGYQQMFFNDGEKVSVDVVKDVVKGTGLNEKWGDFLAEKEKLNGNTAAFGELLKGVCYMNKDNKLPVAAILMSTQEMDFFLLTEVLNDDAPYAKHPLLAQLEEMKQAMQLRMPGTSLKDFSIPDADGKVHKMSEYIGKSKYVLVDFWASWCGPCVREMPNVVEAYKKYKSQGLEIVGVSFDQKKEAWLSAVQRLGMTWPQLSDLLGWKCVAAQLYGVQAIPSNILFDKDGKIIATDLTGKALQSRLAKIFSSAK